MLSEFLKYIDSNKICRKTDRILLGVSGGIDSMVMTHLFISSGFKTAIAHCNFSLRGEESDRDEDLVKITADENKIPFFSKRFETRKFAVENGLSVQMAARELRYSWFETILSEKNYDYVAVAHNLNDNIETFLINLIRGTGISGLTGMKPVCNRIIRPLLFASRHQIEDYCKLYGIPFREDKSNTDTKYTRNKIRHLILPIMKEINPSIEITLDETAEKFSNTYEIVKSYLQIVENKVLIKPEGNVISYSVKELGKYIHNKTLIFELFRPYGIKGRSVVDLINIVTGNTGGRIITSSHILIRNRNELIVFPLAEQPKYVYCEINNIDELSSSPGIEYALKEIVPSDFRVSCDKKTAVLDYSKITFPLIIRRWEKGDSFIPLGMNKYKKLSDYFIDNKFSRLEKENTLILESSGNIVWVIGERIDDRFKITSDTTEILKIRASSDLR